MTAYSLKFFEQNVARIIGEARDNAEAVYITLDDGELMVLRPAEGYEPWSENDPVLNHPANRAHILASLDEYRRGKTVEIVLDSVPSRQP